MLCEYLSGFVLIMMHVSCKLTSCFHYEALIFMHFLFKNLAIFLSFTTLIPPGFIFKGWLFKILLISKYSWVGCRIVQLVSFRAIVHAIYIENLNMIGVYIWHCINRVTCHFCLFFSLSLVLDTSRSWLILLLNAC